MSLEKEYFDILSKKMVRDTRQGYACYFEYNGEKIEKVNGVCNINDEIKEPITFDTHFRLASVTKQFIACGIIRLVKAGKLSFDTFIKELYPNLPSYCDNIRIINLLNHTSGIKDYEDWEHDKDAPQVLDYQILDFLKEQDSCYFEVGTRYQYSNTAYVLLALVIEKVSGEKLDSYMTREVFHKTGLFDTYVNYQGITNIPHRAYGHLLTKDGQLIMKDQYWCSATIGDGGLYSSINDLKKWIDFYLSNDALFLKDTLFSKQREVEKGEHGETYYYGMGMRTIVLEDGKEIYYHCGETIGTNTLVLFSKDLNLKCIFLTNLGNTSTSNLKDNILELIRTYPPIE